MKKLSSLFISFLAMGILVSVMSSVAASPEVTPRFDVTGIWKTGPYSYPFFQNDGEVKSILVANNFGHYYSGEFISPTQFKGIMTRRQKSNGCITMIEITYTMTSNNTMTEEQLYLDSHCDLPQGKRINASYTRVE